MPVVADKPLGRKAYGSIGHLPDSRLGPGDHSCPSGYARIATDRLRDRRDRVIVTEKLDGSNVAVARLDGIIVPLIRAGYRAVTSKREQHQLFHVWAMTYADVFLGILEDGERLCGEWLAQAHGTRYNLPHSPFVAFDLMRDETRLPTDQFGERVVPYVPTARILHDGGPFAVERAIEAIEDRTHHGAVDPVEGAVWRVERDGRVDFLTKWVRPDKVDGKYLPDVSGKPAVWNWRP